MSLFDSQSEANSNTVWLGDKQTATLAHLGILFPRFWLDSLSSEVGVGREARLLLSIAYPYLARDAVLR